MSNSPLDVSAERWWSALGERAAETAAERERIAEMYRLERRRARHREYYWANRDEILASKREQYRESREYYREMGRKRDRRSAEINRGAPPRAWTAAEDETVLRSDLTITQMALLCGRTVASVKSRRRRLPRDSTVT